MLFRYIAIHSIMGFSDRLDWVREEDKKKQLYPVWVFLSLIQFKKWMRDWETEREKKASIAPWRFSFLFFSFLFLDFGQKNWPFNAFISIYQTYFYFQSIFFIPYFTLSNNPQHGADDDDDDFQIQVFT